MFTCSWDSPGCHEGIWVREVPALGSAYYRRWPGGGYWCSRITVAFGECLVHLLLGDTDAEQQLIPSADNIAVAFPPELLPDWASDN